MKFIKKYAFPLFVVFSSGLGFLSPAVAQYASCPHDPTTCQILENNNELIQQGEQLVEILERRQKLKSSCNAGNQKACSEIQRLDRQLEIMMQRNNSR